jgi:AraC-like DNA-binding protein
MEVYEGKFSHRHKEYEVYFIFDGAAEFLEALIDCGKMEGPLRKIASKSRVASLFSQIYLLKPTGALKPDLPDERVQMIRNYVGENFREDLTLEKISERFGFTKNYLNTLFHKAEGMPIMKYVTVKRLEFARQEIVSGVRLGEAAAKAGFSDYAVFFRAYKSFYGSLPSALLVSREGRKSLK